jgi:hypothetical protein
VPSWRHLVPGALVAGLAGSFGLALATRRARWALAVAVPYTLGVAAAAGVEGRRRGSPVPLVGAAMSTMHLAYGCGFVRGLLDVASTPATDARSTGGGRPAQV